MKGTKFTFGDQPTNIDLTATLSNAYRRGGIDDFTLTEDDLEVYETEYQTSSATILMIDDDADLTAALKILLEGKGHRFHTAANGELGLRRVKETSPDLIILDVMMDTRTEGFHVSLRLRDRSPESEFAPWREVPILMLTSIHESTRLRFGPDEDYLPVNALLEKSVRFDVILEKAEELLKAPRASQV